MNLAPIFSFDKYIIFRCEEQRYITIIKGMRNQTCCDLQKPCACKDAIAKWYVDAVTWLVKGTHTACTKVEFKQEPKCDNPKTLILLEKL